MRPPGHERTWCHEIEYRALTCKEPRRVVLVVVETPGELFLRSFSVVTSLTKEELCDRDVHDFFRARGAREGHIGKFQSVIDGSLSSTNRQKKLYARKPVTNRATPVDAERVNAAALCTHGLAFNLQNTFRALLGASTSIDKPPEMELRQVRKLLLVPGRIVVPARRATLVIIDSALASWRRAWRRIEAFHPSPCQI